MNTEEITKAETVQEIPFLTLDDLTGKDVRNAIDTFSNLEMISRSRSGAPSLQDFTLKFAQPFLRKAITLEALKNPYGFLDSFFTGSFSSTIDEPGYSLTKEEFATLVNELPEALAFADIANPFQKEQFQKETERWSQEKAKSFVSLYNQTQDFPENRAAALANFSYLFTQTREEDLSRVTRIYAAPKLLSLLDQYKSAPKLIDLFFREVISDCENGRWHPTRSQFETLVREMPATMNHLCVPDLADGAREWQTRLGDRTAQRYDVAYRERNPDAGSYYTLEAIANEASDRSNPFHIGSPAPQYVPAEDSIRGNGQESIKAITL
jgi:hypothetical protein